MRIKDFYKRCDKFIEEWLDGANYSADPFLAHCRKGSGLRKKEYTRLLPELFWGNPNRCLVVIINLNPGYGNDDKQYIGRKTLLRNGQLASGYSTFARTNPCLVNASFHPAATAWWSQKLKWIHKVFDCFDDRRLPFMLELCPWHSKKWAEVKINVEDNNQLDYIRNYVIAPAAYASKYAKEPIIISIGKAGEIYKKLGFCLLKTWGPNQHDDFPQWPENKKNDDAKVYFDYYACLEKNIHILNIWMEGSNHTPSDRFFKIEQGIIKCIKNNMGKPLWLRIIQCIMSKIKIIVHSIQERCQQSK